MTSHFRDTKQAIEAGDAIDLSVVIACYNEAGHIRQSLPMLERVLIASGERYELIVIDDCSSDGTQEILHEMLDGRGDVTLRFHEKNVGRGGTIQEGIRLARGRVVGYLDIDLEVGPWYILPALDILENHRADGVIAHRVYKLRAHPVVLIRQMMSICFRKLSHLFLNIPVHDSAGGFKFFLRERILPVLDLCENRHWFWDTEVVYLGHLQGLKFSEIPTLFIRRPEKTSTVKVVSDTIRHFAALFRLWWRSKRLQSGAER